MPTLTIPLVSLPVGQTVTSPLTVGGNTQAVITLDKTVVGGMNSLTSDSSMDITIQSSPDGVTWNNEVEDEGIVCGPIINYRTSLPYTSFNLQVTGLDPAATKVRAVVVVTGPSPVAVAGTIVAT